MIDLPFASIIGTPTFDLARYSAPPGPVDRVEVFEGGLCLLEFPRMEHVNAVEAPGQGGDVIIRFSERIAHLDRTIAPEMWARDVRAGSFVLIPEGLTTSWHAESGQPLCHHIHIPRALREEWAEDFGAGALRPLVNQRATEIDALFARIVAEMQTDQSYRRLRLQGLALAAVAATYRLAGATAVRPSSQSMTVSRLRRVRTYVEENLSSDVSLEEMAASVGLSPGHFSRAFKAETGLSPYAFVVQSRVERVKHQLLNTRRSLAEIAVDCGFATQSHMTDTFRRATGMPPARWLREMERKRG